MDDRLTRETLKGRINNFFMQETNQNERFYPGDEKVYHLYFRQHLIADEGIDIQSTKWKTYLYLMKCVMDYIDFYGSQKLNLISQTYKNPTELSKIIAFLEDETKYGRGKTKTTNKTWLTARLLDKQEKESDEIWGSGEHEWLLRSLIIEVLKRSAGMYTNIQAYEEDHCIFPSYNWLMLQAELRTKTKYIFFENTNGSLESGHTGAMKENPRKRGFLTEGSPKFHEKLESAFHESTTIAGFLIRVENIIKTDMVSGKYTINPSQTANSLVDNSKTNDPEQLEKFRANKLYPEGYVTTRLIIWGTKQRLSHFDNKDIEASEESLSDSEGENVAKWMSVTNNNSQ